MKSRTITTMLVAATALLALADAVSAYYSPRLGRFLSRDPIAEPGAVLVRQATRPGTSFIPRDPADREAEQHLCRFVGNAPVNYVDPYGLWKVEREGGAFAWATSEDRDTIAGLAQQIGLDANDYKNWLTTMHYWRSNPMPSSATQPLDACYLFKIPNTVIAWWGGELGGFGKFWVMWDTDVNTFKRRGFNVIDTGPNTAAALEGDISTYQGQKQLQGIFFWGHGYLNAAGTQGEGVLTDSDHKGDPAYYSDYAKWHPQYKMAIGIIFACHSAGARSDFSGNAIFWGKQGVLVPHGAHLFGPTVAELIPRGAQGTRK